MERAAEKDLRRLSDEVHDRIIEGISALSSDPRPSGAKKLSGSKAGYRIRIGHYRVLYEIADSVRIVRVYRVAHRRDAYR